MAERADVRYAGVVIQVGGRDTSCGPCYSKRRKTHKWSVSRRFCASSETTREGGEEDDGRSQSASAVVVLNVVKTMWEMVW